MKEIYDQVLSYSKVKDHLSKHPDDKKTIIKHIDEIKGDYRFGVVGGAVKFIDQTFMKLYDGVQLDTPKDFDIKKLQEDYHLILVPNHQSHADYIALQYILFKWFRTAVHIAGGINLNIFPLGTFFRKCGAFFIRRRFDDEVYKIAFQGYIYYLLKSDKIVEFFFEGGRTRTGKLLPPKYGLFSMLLDAHSKFGEDKKPLMFIPVSLAHEMIPEERAHAKELHGAKKVKESPMQLFKIFKLFNKKLGTVHVRFSKGIVVKETNDLKDETQKLAFRCFRAVGRGMPVTPSSLLSLVMLDDPAGILTWKQIEDRALDVIGYCDYMKIPMTNSLSSEHYKASLKVAMDMFINNKKASLVKKEKLNQIFYALNEESRLHLLYHKNMILHHFLVPGIVNVACFNIFSGNIKTEADLARFLNTKRKELKYEFYLPTVREMVSEALKIVELATGEKISKISQALEFTPEKLYSVAMRVKRFSTAFSYIYEAYYIAVVAIKYIGEDFFDEDQYIQIARELFLMEKEHGRVVKYPESFSVPLMKDTLKYLTNLNVLENEDGKYKVIYMRKVNYLIEKFSRDVNDQFAINLKLNE